MEFLTRITGSVAAGRTQGRDGSPSQSLFPVDAAIVKRRSPPKVRDWLGEPSLPWVRSRWRGYLKAALGLLASLAWVSAPNLRAAGNSKEAGSGDATATLELKGLLIPLDQANLSSRSTGVIRDMKKEGDSVKKGEIVVSLDDDAEKLAVENAKAVLEVRQFEAGYTKVLRDKGSGSEADARTAEANRKSAVIQLKEAEVALEKKSVHSPFDGVVTRHIRSVGEATDNYLPLLSLADLSKVYLETYLPANRLRDLQTGQPVEVSVPDLPDRKFAGTIEYIAPVIDPASGEFRVKILLPNDDHALRSGMGAVGLLQVAHAELHAAGSNPKSSASVKRPD